MVTGKNSRAKFVNSSNRAVLHSVGTLLADRGQRFPDGKPFSDQAHCFHHEMVLGDQGRRFHNRKKWPRRPKRGTSHKQNRRDSLGADGEEGSISLLVIGLFIVVLTLSMAIVDIAGSIVVKMDLTHIGEAAISTAAHSLDLQRYYLSDRIFVRESTHGPIYRVPIDCDLARTKFEKEIELETIKGEQLVILSWQCVSDTLEAQIAVDVPPLVPIPFPLSPFGGNGENSPSNSGLFRIIATVKAESLVTG